MGSEAEKQAQLLLLRLKELDVSTYLNYNCSLFLIKIIHGVLFIINFSFYT